jgi:hypothetical protein
MNARVNTEPIPKTLDPFMAEEGCLDTKELLLKWGLPHFIPIPPTPKSVRSALKHAGYAVRYFIREKKNGKQVNELGLRRVSAPYLEGEQPLVEHFIEILRHAHVEVAPENVVVSLDSWRHDRLWLGFQAVLH